MQEMQWNIEDFTDGSPITNVSIAPKRGDATEDELTHISNILIAITTAIILATVIVIIAFFCYMLWNRQKFFNVDYNRSLENELSESIIRIDSGIPAEIVPPLQNVLPHNVATDENFEVEYEIPVLNHTYDEVQDIAPFQIKDNTSVVALHGSLEEIFDSENYNENLNNQDDLQSNPTALF